MPWLENIKHRNIIWIQTSLPRQKYCLCNIRSLKALYFPWEENLIKLNNESVPSNLCFWTKFGLISCMFQAFMITKLGST